MQERLAGIASSTRFELAIGGLLIVNFGIHVTETYYLDNIDVYEWLVFIDKLFVGFFVLEILFRNMAFGVIFWKSIWNVIDVILVGCSVLAYLVDPNSSLGILLTILRSARVLRLITLSPTLRYWLQATLYALKIGASCGLVFLILMLFYALAGCVLYAKGLPDHFGNFHTALNTLLFQAFIFDDVTGLKNEMRAIYWSTILYLNIFVAFAFITIIIVGSVTAAALVDYVTRNPTDPTK